MFYELNFKYILYKQKRINKWSFKLYVLQIINIFYIFLKIFKKNI